MKFLGKIQSYFENDSKKRNYYLVYTVLFIFLACIIFSWFLIVGKTFVWGPDGLQQHLTSLIYYSHYLKDILRNLLFNHKLVIPDWNFYIGEGADIVNTLHYYAIGDPLTLLCVFVPSRFMHLFYSMLSILRLYLAGIAFSALCFGTGKKNRYGVLAGALSYCFCFWGLLNAARHPYFLTPMIYFPLMILGIEKIIKKERPYIFIFATAASAASNFYFFYMVVLLAVAYAIIRLAMLYKKDIKKSVAVFSKMLVMAFIGVCIAGIILMPVLMMFLSDSRMSVSQPFKLFYPLYHYSSLPGLLVAADMSSWICGGFTAPVVLAIFLLFFKKNKDSLLKILFMCCVIVFLFPILGRILHGMAYATNRWSWAFAILCCYILVSRWDALVSLSKRDWNILAVSTAVYYAVCMLCDKSRSQTIFSAIAIIFITLLMLNINLLKEVKPKQFILIASVMISIINLSFWHFSPSAGNYVEGCYGNPTYSDNEAPIVKSVADTPYPRYAGDWITENVNFLHEISNTQYFWSLSNPNMNSFRKGLQMREPAFSLYQGYDDRTTPITLSAVQYYTVKNQNYNGIPYGYTPIHTKGRYTVYKNDFALPLGYCYDSYITEEKWNSLNPVQKQEIQLNAAYINETPPDMQKYDESMSEYTVPFDLECQEKNIVKTETGIVTTAEKQKITITIKNNTPGSETYIGFTGLEYTPTPGYDLYTNDESVDPNNLYNMSDLSPSKRFTLRKEKKYWDYVQNTYIFLDSPLEVRKELFFQQPGAAFSAGRHDFIINAGYSKEPLQTVTLTFDGRGIYKFDSLKVYSIPLSGYEEKIARLQKDTLQNVSLDTDTVYGDISVDFSKILCVAIPFSKGWTAYIDGEKTETFPLNERYIGMVVPKGQHKVKLHYAMPYKKEGVLISIAGFVMLAITAYAIEIKKAKAH